MYLYSTAIKPKLLDEGAIKKAQGKTFDCTTPTMIFSAKSAGWDPNSNDSNNRKIYSIM